MNQTNQKNSTTGLPTKLPKPDKSRKKLALPAWTIIPVILVGLAIIGIVGCVFYEYYLATSTAGESEIVERKTTETPENIYFGYGWEGQYSFINIDTEETKELIPAGYEIVDQHSYNNFPSYVILRQDNKLFSYSIKNQKLTEISLDTLKDSEKIRLDPSLSDSSQFYLVVNDTKETGGMFGFEIIGTRKYFLDAHSNQLTSADNLKLPGVTDFSGCSKYDSENSRFFIWPCGEGIGSSIPLSTFDINSLQEKEVVTLAEFGLEDDDLGPVGLEYNNGLFIALKKGQIDKIIVINPRHSEPQKEVYSISEKIQKDIADSTYPYGVTIDRSSKTIVVGGSSVVTFLRFNQEKQIVDSKIMVEDKVYANFIFSHQGKLYYRAKGSEAVRVVSLDSWEVEKSITIKPDEEITLFSIAN